jgi:hypothetical protein
MVAWGMHAPSPSSPPTAAPRSGWVVAGLATWLALAIVVGALGLLGRLRPPGPQLVILALTLVLLAASRLVRPLRLWVERVDWRWLVAVHLGRAAAGATFLALVARGALPRQFVQAGVGDVTVAVLALGLLAFVPPTRPGARRLYLAWNVLGLVDILLVLATGVRIGMRDPAAIAGFGRLPLALLPLFFVPLVLATHVWLFARLRRAHAPARGHGARDSASPAESGR